MCQTGSSSDRRGDTANSGTRTSASASSSGGDLAALRVTRLRGSVKIVVSRVRALTTQYSRTPCSSIAKHLHCAILGKAGIGDLDHQQHAVATHVGCVQCSLEKRKIRALARRMSPDEARFLERSGYARAGSCPKNSLSAIFKASCRNSLLHLGNELPPNQLEPLPVLDDAGLDHLLEFRARPCAARQAVGNLGRPGSRRHDGLPVKDGGFARS